MWFLSIILLSPSLDGCYFNDYCIESHNPCEITTKKQKEHRALKVGSLDAFGTAWPRSPRNSFEQLCINFANEKLQQHFNMHMHLGPYFVRDWGSTWALMSFSRTDSGWNCMTQTAWSFVLPVSGKPLYGVRISIMWLPVRSCSMASWQSWTTWGETEGCKQIVQIKIDHSFDGPVSKNHGVSFYRRFESEKICWAIGCLCSPTRPTPERAPFRVLPRFSLEQRLYTSEGINWSHITWQELPQVTWATNHAGPSIDRYLRAGEGVAAGQKKGTAVCLPKRSNMYALFEFQGGSIHVYPLFCRKSCPRWHLSCQSSPMEWSSNDTCRTISISLIRWTNDH